MNDPIQLYLDLMKRCLTYYIWGESIYIWGESIELVDTDTDKVKPFFKRFIINKILRYLGKDNMHIAYKFPYDPEKRAAGKDWPPLAHTMIGLQRLDNLQDCIEDVIKNNISGDLIETGVWRGGASIFMRAVLKAYGVKGRTVWVADSFEGLPAPDVQKYPQDTSDIHHKIRFLAVSLDEVKANFAKYGLLDEQVRFLKGWFKDTLPKAPIEKLAVLRLDGDMYESTMDGLVNLYSLLSKGGYVILDDYVLKGCKQAVHDFRTQHGIINKIINIDGTGAYWQRT